MSAIAAAAAVRSRAPQALLLGRRAVARSGCVTIGGRGARFESSQSPGSGRSFQGQMMESITKRMERDKADRERMEKMRKTTPAARNAATTFSTHNPLALISPHCVVGGLTPDTLQWSSSPARCASF